MRYFQRRHDLLRRLLALQDAPPSHVAVTDENAAVVDEIDHVQRVGAEWLVVSNKGGWAILTDDEYEALHHAAPSAVATAALYRRNLVSWHGAMHLDDTVRTLASCETASKVIQVQLTNDCNLRCRYCFVDGSHAAGISVDPISSDEGRLVATVSELVRKYAAAGKEVFVEFSGGEPLLRLDETLALVKELRRVAPITPTMQTNATLVTEEVARRLQQAGFVVSVSLDGSAQQNRYRTFRDGRSSHAQAVAGIRQLQLAGILSGVVLVVHEANYQKPADVVETMLDLGVRNFKANLCISHDRASLPKHIARYSVFMKGLVEQFLHHAPALRESNIASYLDALASGMQRYRCFNAQCGSGRDFLAVRPDGRVVPCASYPGLSKRQWSDIGERTTAKIAECRQCRWRAYCGGGCSARSYLVYGTAQSPSAHCAFVRDFLPFLLEQYVRLGNKLLALGRGLETAELPLLPQEFPLQHREVS